MPLPPHRDIVVFKLGGSLLNLPGLAEHLRQILSQRPDAAHLVVVGGGAAADIVREWDQIHHLGESAAHALALEAMALNEALIHHLLPELRLVRSPKQFDQAVADGRPALLCAGCFVRWGTSNGHPLAESWDVTSDSIAAWSAGVLSAKELVLLKSTASPVGLSLIEAARAGLVDAAFPPLAAKIPVVSWVNARSAELRFERWLTYASPRKPTPD